MATSKALNRNRLKTMFVNLWKHFYCFPYAYYDLNGNSEDLPVESFAVSTHTPFLCRSVTIFHSGFPPSPISDSFPPTVSRAQTPHLASPLIRNAPLERPLLSEPVVERLEIP